MKLLSIAISSYNAAAYLHYCVESLVIGGEQVGILIINDGSQDQTQEIAECLASKYPNIVRAIYQENKCHGGAVNRGLAEASGRYFKVVDSDDWVDPRAYLKILETLQELESKGQEVDVFVTNFVYEKEGQSRKKSMSYDSVLPVRQICCVLASSNCLNILFMSIISLSLRPFSRSRPCTICLSISIVI